MLLADLQAVFADCGADRLPSFELCNALARMEHRPWPEWKAGKPITPRQLARLLAPHRVSPGTIRLDDGTTPKGYYLSAFADAFARYLAPERTSNTPQRHKAQETSEIMDFQSASEQIQVWRIEEAKIPANPRLVALWRIAART